MQITIVTAYDKTFDTVGNISTKSKCCYAIQKSMNINVHRFGFDESRPPSWSKIKFILQAFEQGTEWIWWMDADLFVTNLDYNITPLLTEGDVIVACDTNGLNCGSFLIRNCDWSKKFLNEVWNQIEFVNHQWWEQAAFMRLSKKAEHFLHFHYVPLNTINSYPDVWSPQDAVVHFAGYPDKLSTINAFQTQHGISLL